MVRASLIITLLLLGACAKRATDANGIPVEEEIAESGEVLTCVYKKYDDRYVVCNNGETYKAVNGHEKEKRDGHPVW